MTQADDGWDGQVKSFGDSNSSAPSAPPAYLLTYEGPQDEGKLVKEANSLSIEDSLCSMDKLFAS